MRKRVEEYAAADKAAHVARFTLYDDLSKQLFSGHPALMVDVAAHSGMGHETMRALGVRVDSANVKLQAMLSAQTVLQRATTQSVAPAATASGMGPVVHGTVSGVKRVALSMPEKLLEGGGSLMSARYRGTYTVGGSDAV